MNTKYHQTDGFKFNPAGLIGLDAGTAKGISKFLRARERELNTIVTDVITCEGGPFNGQQIELQPNGGLAAPAKSADFTVGAWRGHYLGSRWVSTLEANAPAPEAMAAPLPHPKINCDLPAKGFDQLRYLLGEMSINPLERETHLKPITRLKYFKYGQTDDFGYAIEDAAPAGAYSVSLSWTAAKIKRKNRSVCRHIVNRTPHDGNTWAIDDYGDLFKIQRQENHSTDAERVTVYHPFTTYKIGRGSYTIPATIEAVERLASKLLKIKKWHSDKLQTSTRICSTYKETTQQAAPMAIEALAILLPKIEQPVKPLEPIKIEQTTEQQQMANPEFFYRSKRQLIDTYLGESKYKLPDLLAKTQAIINDKANPYSDFAARVLENFNDWVSHYKYKQTDNPPSLTPKIEQPAKLPAPPPATTCNPDAARLRAKAAICRAANRPTWAEKLEAQADALDRVDPPEPPPCKHKRQRPRKTACILLAKIRHPAGHFAGQKYGQPFRQNFSDHLAERLISNGHEPPGIKTNTPPAHFYQPNPRLNPCHVHNLPHATHQPPPYKSKQSAVIYPCQPLPNFAASTWRHGRLGKLHDTACRHPFGGFSTSYWITPSYRTRIKLNQPWLKNRGKRLDVTA